MKLSIKDRIDFDLNQIKDKKYLIGLDEVGWGTIAGDLCIGCVIIAKDLLLDFPIEGKLSKIRDSKKLSAKIRNEIEMEVNNNPIEGLKTFIGQASVEYINEHGLAQAYDHCLEQIFNYIKDTVPLEDSLLLLDGSRIPEFLKSSSIERNIVVKGDDLSVVIGLASIMAKEHRDRHMNYLDVHYPAYLWKDNKGYGTAGHIEALKKDGITPFHRTKGTTTILS